MTWSRLLDRIADRDERIPAALIVHRFEPMEAGQPARNLWPRPQATVGGRRLDPLLERSQCRRREDGGLRAVVDALVAEGLGAAFVVASDQLAHPPRRERQQLC